MGSEAKPQPIVLLVHVNLIRWSLIIISLSLVLCCYQQVYDIFNMSCLGVIQQVRGRDAYDDNGYGYLFARKIVQLIFLNFRSNFRDGTSH